jgi:hypothetical protein
MTPISPVDPRRPTNKRPEGRSLRSFSDAITTESTAPTSTVTWLAITMIDDRGWTTTVNACAKVNGPTPTAGHRQNPRQRLPLHRTHAQYNDDGEPDQEAEP